MAFNIGLTKGNVTSYDRWMYNRLVNFGNEGLRLYDIQTGHIKNWKSHATGGSTKCFFNQLSIFKTLRILNFLVYLLNWAILTHS